jgi:hypothetical protein
VDAFNYLAVMISIILGLGIAQLLAGLGRCIARRDALRSHVPTLLWVGILLLMHMQTWWSMFGLRALQQWNFVAFTVVLLQPIVLYLLATLALPEQEEGVIDLRSNYFRQRRWFFAFMVLLLVVSVLKDFVAFGSFPAGFNLAFHLAFAAASIAAMATEKSSVHLAIASVSALAMLAYVGFLFGQLQ